MHTRMRSAICNVSESVACSAVHKADGALGKPGTYFENIHTHAGNRHLLQFQIGPCSDQQCISEEPPGNADIEHALQLQNERHTGHHLNDRQLEATYLTAKGVQRYHVVRSQDM